MKRFLILIFLLIFGCSKGPQKFKVHFYAMDTLIEVTLFAPSKSKAQALVEDIKNEALRIEKKFSAFKPNSAVKAINERPDRNYCRTDPEVLAMIRTALAYGRETAGLFDITIGPLKWAWGFGTDLKYNRPSDKMIRELIKHIDYSKLSISGDTLYFADPDINIDLGGIAKGYALRQMTQIFGRHGITSFMLNAGGDIVCGDKKPGGGDWVVGIQHPRDKSQLIRTTKLHNACVVTSGDYERFFVEDSVRYHHIFDPKTGYPARGYISATVVSHDIVRADVMATALVAGGKRPPPDSLPGVQSILLIDEDLKFYGR